MLQPQFAAFARLLTNANGQDLFENSILSLRRSRSSEDVGTWPTIQRDHPPPPLPRAGRYLTAPLITSSSESARSIPSQFDVRPREISQCAENEAGAQTRSSVLTPQLLNSSPAAGGSNYYGKQPDEDGLINTLIG